MHSILSLGAFLVALALPHSGYCGTVGDTHAIQTTFLRTHADVARSDIMAIATYGGRYGQVMYQGAGVAAEYYRKFGAVWRDAGTVAPVGFPGKATRYFSVMQNLRANGGSNCANPAFVAEGSG